jgi:hypothetical protein
MGCISCGRGLCFECSNPCCCEKKEESKDYISFSDSGEDKKPKDIERDVSISAGRKEAAVLYPIEDGMICEWAQLANCGGGLKPIVGCVGNKATHIHHGPDKKTTNNTPGNIHRICVPCHNLWHGQNNSIYERELYRTLPHSPRPATIEEMLTRKIN